MNLFDRLVDTALQHNASLKPLATVVEKELLHHDILREMSGAGLLEKLTFMGGTCLRMCYGSNRLSEDLDFTGGNDFCRTSLRALPSVLTDKLQVKYGLKIEVSEPQRESGNVDTWKLKIVTRPEHRGMPVQRINIDICAVPSYDRRPMMLRNYYGIDMGTSGLIVQAESREEILADKLIALALRSGRIKNRDLWDIVWLKQRGVTLSTQLLMQKIADHRHTVDSYVGLLTSRRDDLASKDTLRIDFVKEMVRFLPAVIVTESIENKSFWGYLIQTIIEDCNLIISLLTDKKIKPTFNM